METFFATKSIYFRIVMKPFLEPKYHDLSDRQIIAFSL